MDKLTYVTLQKKIRDLIPETQRDNFDLQFAGHEKNPSTALILSLVVGSFGVDRFYLGQIGLGVLKLITLGGLGVWTFIDWFLIMGATRAKNIKIAKNLKSNVC